jgi:hypothetical protein
VAERSVGADDLAPSFEENDVSPAARSILAEPPLHADPPEPDPLVESEASSVLGEDPREERPVAGLL